MFRTALLLVLCLCIGWGQVRSEASVVDHNDLDMIQEILEWAQANGAFINEKVEFKMIVGTLSGLFAKEPIQEGEVVTDIPLNLVLRPPSKMEISSHYSEDDDHDDDEDEDPHATWCANVDFVHSIIMKPSHLQTPFERYLAARENKHPYFWSRKAKDLFRELVNENFPTMYLDAEDDNEDGTPYFRRCGKEQTQTIEKAIMILETRGEGPGATDFIPIHELVNHGNGHQANLNPSFVDDSRYRMIAQRDIMAGEQLQASYTECDAWCLTPSDHSSSTKKEGLVELEFHVTSQILELYGFVEQLPHIWALPPVSLLFTIDSTESEEGDGLQVNFILLPNETGINFLRGELHHLEAFEKAHRERQDIVSHELDAILDLHRAMVTAYTAAVQRFDTDYSLHDASDEL
eukprot:Nitzschia sp. Nitz4//scaffold31_size150131//103710//105019//NITZ4_002842-RA/size150131-augustus-gene-0.7-mRNA-1//1//CDS//3329547701//7843//frame0